MNLQYFLMMIDDLWSSNAINIFVKFYRADMFSDK